MEIKQDKPIRMWMVTKNDEILALFRNFEEAKEYTIKQKAILNTWKWLIKIEE